MCISLPTYDLSFFLEVVFCFSINVVSSIASFRIASLTSTCTPPSYGENLADVQLTVVALTALARDSGRSSADHSSNTMANVLSRWASGATETTMGSSTYVEIRAVAVPITAWVKRATKAASRAHVSGAPREPCVVFRKTTYFPRCTITK